MAKVRLQTLKGFRDFLPVAARRREYVIYTLRGVFVRYGFEPLETPALEYEEILMGKYGEEGDKLMYRFRDNGGRKVALRYDQTVPLARVVAQYASAGSTQVTLPFKRYQIQPVWRAENTQKGRYREFLQCDADIVGTSSPLADAEVIACAIEAVGSLLPPADLVMKINDRQLFEGTPAKFLVTLDKLPKIGREKAIEELVEKGMKKDEAEGFVDKFKNAKPTKNLEAIFSYLKAKGFKEGQDFEFDPLIVRGLDYYTGTIFELVDKNNPSLSLAGGGRFDNLIGMFLPAQAGSNNTIPAVGFAIGFDRLMETIEAKGLFTDFESKPRTKVLVTVFSPDLAKESVEAATRLRFEFPTELYPDETAKLDKQLKYADKVGIPYVIIIGEEEKKAGVVTLKNMKGGKQEKVTLEEVIKRVAH